MMKKAYILFYTLGFFSCSKVDKTLMFETSYNNKKFKINQCHHYTSPNLFGDTNGYLAYEFSLGTTEPFEINSLSNQTGLPYDENVLKNLSYHYFDTTKTYCTIDNPEQVIAENTDYLKNANFSENEKADILKFAKEDVYKNLKTERKRFFKYIDQKKYSKTEFDALASAIATNIKTIDSMLFACKPYTSFRSNYDGWQFCGIVLGNEDDLCEIYKKNDEDFFKIFPDGRIMHYY